MSRLFDFFKSPKQKLEDELNKLRQEIENDKYIKRIWLSNNYVRYPNYPNDSVRKTDEELEKEWKKMYLYKDFDENGNDRHILRRMYELQTQIDTIIQEEEKENQEEQKTNDAWRDARYQGLLSRSGGKSGKRKNKKNTKIKIKTKKIKNKSRRRYFKKRMQ